MALRQYRPDLYQNEEYIPKEQQATYQPYQTHNPRREHLSEFLFFVNIAIFSILTVISTYTYLSLKVPTFLAFLLAVGTGAVGLRIVQIFLKKQLRKAYKK